MKLRLILIVLSLLAFLSASTGGYLYYSSLREDAFKEAERQANTRVKMIKKNLSSYLLENRKRIHKKFKKDNFFNPSEIDITSADELFLQQCHQTVEENISNPDFTMENFANKVHLSRTQLHKKLKSLTGNSATEYVKILRLKKAAILLESGFGNITEIAYETGFSNPSYFAECFKKFHKTSPIKYAQSFKNKHI